MSLISRIEALNKYEDPRNSDYDFNQGYNQALDDGKHVIKTELEPKDRPDRIGWWIDWDNKTCIYVEIDVIPFYFDKNGYRVNCKKGKWIKAIVPIGDGE